MLSLLVKFFAMAGAIMLVVSYVPGITIYGGWVTLLLVAALWSVVTNIIKPILNILTLPITFVTLGLSSLAINAVLFWAMSLIVPGFTVEGVVPAVLGSLALSLCGWVIDAVL
ncbi:MAG: phage holin family protein [Minisyncoccia bacterium]